MDIFNSIWTSMTEEDEAAAKDESRRQSRNDEIFGESGSLNPQKPKIQGVYRVEQAKSPKKTTIEQEHSHPMQRNAMVEMKPKYIGSLGDVNDEGCVEHADERFVLKQEDLHLMKSKSKMREYIIFSEVLAKPKCRR